MKFKNKKIEFDLEELMPLLVGETLCLLGNFEKFEWQNDFFMKLQIF